MAQFDSRELIELEFEFDYDIDPGYRGSSIEPPEAPTVTNLTAHILGPKKLRIPVPDDILEFLATDALLESLLSSAQAAQEEARCAWANARREDY